jgi:hypothetical protein
MPEIVQIALIIILVLTCIVTSFSTGHNARVIRRQIKESQSRLAQLKRGKDSRISDVRELQKSLSRLEKELSNAEQSSLFPGLSSGESLLEKVRSSLPIIIGIVLGVMVGAIVIVLIPVILIIVLFTIAVFVGSSGLFSEFIRNENKALALSILPASLYAVTQVFVVLGLYQLFDMIFWIFDIVVVLTLIGITMILGKEVHLEIALILVAVLTVWDIYAVLFSNIMGSAISNLAYTLFSVLIPTGTGYALIGGGDFFFSYLLVSAFTRRLKRIPVALILLIGASVTALIVVMTVAGQRMAPALPAVLAAGLLSIIYYRKELRERTD